MQSGHTIFSICSKYLQNALCRSHRNGGLFYDNFVRLRVLCYGASRTLDEAQICSSPLQWMNNLVTMGHSTSATGNGSISTDKNQCISLS